MGPSTGGMPWREEVETWHIACSGLNFLLEEAQMNGIAFGEDAGELFA
jgi:hypothetical protein